MEAKRAQNCIRRVVDGFALQRGRVASRECAGVQRGDHGPRDRCVSRRAEWRPRQLQPQGQLATTDTQGQFTITNLAPGPLTLTISYVGMAQFSMAVSVTSGQVSHVDAELKLAGVSDNIIVTAERPHGEAEAINLERTADNIVQALPAEVITSLPNANIADALGRLPSVTLERDEGEGKYVQIRGTEPRLSNTTIDGVNVPSPETGVRQIKLDVLASDLVSEVQINKTLQANMDGDGIGGSVNLVTKTAGDVPTLSLFGLGGYTPISGGRGVDQFGATVGKRFGASKRLGVLLGGTYDWNGRGINDIEPVPTAGSASPHYDSIDLRDYIYYRTRWGFAGSVDYKLGDSSSVYARTFYSDFRDYGNKWVYTLNDGDVPQMSQDWRAARITQWAWSHEASSRLRRSPGCSGILFCLAFSPTSAGAARQPTVGMAAPLIIAPTIPLRRRTAISLDSARAALCRGRPTRWTAPITPCPFLTPDQRRYGSTQPASFRLLCPELSHRAAVSAPSIRR